jgi:DNA modification methylase
LNNPIIILTGDCREVLATLPDESVHCCVTSPPYYGLRDYLTGTWEGGDPECKHVVGEMRRGLGLATSIASTRGGGHKAAMVADIQAQGDCPHCGAVRVDRQIGQENSPEEYVATLVAVFRQVRRLLREDGTLWLNLGDSYANDTKWGGTMGGKHAKGLHGTGGIGRTRNLTGLASKNLIGIPWQVAFALRAGFATCSCCNLELRTDLWPVWNGHRVCIGCVSAGRRESKVVPSEPGWILRQDIIWSKPNPMPESVTDRCTKAHEYLFLFSKSTRYHYDAEAILEPVSRNTHARLSQDLIGQHGVVKNNASFDAAVCLPVSDRNKRDVWTVASAPFSGAHFATYPPALIRPCILAGCPTKGTHCDCNEIIATPTGENDLLEDPSLLVGRAGMARPRGKNEGVRPITRRAQRSDAEQIKASPHFEAMRKICGGAFEHYVRTDLVGARPLPADIRHAFLDRGWITEATPCDCEVQLPGVVLDPFAGSGTTGMVALELGRRAILIDLNASQVPMIQDRCNVTPGFAFESEGRASNTPA